jgi:anaerobic ribonucleoside-triphosphate reductase
MPTVTAVEICPRCGSELEAEPDSTEPCPICGWEPSQDDDEEIEE